VYMQGLITRIRNIICIDNDNIQNDVISISSCEDDDEYKQIIGNITDEFMRATQLIYDKRCFKVYFLYSCLEYTIKDKCCYHFREFKHIEYERFIKDLCRDTGITLLKLDKPQDQNNTYYTFDYSLSEQDKKSKYRVKMALVRCHVFSVKLPDVIHAEKAPGTDSTEPVYHFSKFVYWGDGYFLYVEKHEHHLVILDIMTRIYQRIWRYVNGQTQNPNKNLKIPEIIKERNFPEKNILNTEPEFLEQLATSFQRDLLGLNYLNPDDHQKISVQLRNLDYIDPVKRTFSDFKNSSDSTILFFKRGELSDYTGAYIPSTVYNSYTDKTQKTTSNLHYLVWLAEIDSLGFTRHCPVTENFSRFFQYTDRVCMLVYCKDFPRQKRNIKMLEDTFEKYISSTNTKQIESWDGQDYKEKVILLQNLADYYNDDIVSEKYDDKTLKDKLLQAIPIINEIYCRTMSQDDNLMLDTFNTIGQKCPDTGEFYKEYNCYIMHVLKRVLNYKIQ